MSVEQLFEIEHRLRIAAQDYAAVKCDENRKRPRAAAIVYANIAKAIESAKP